MENVEYPISNVRVITSFDRHVKEALDLIAEKTN